MPAPAFVSTMTSWPAAAYSRAAPGVSPTRYSCDLISFATPTFITGLLPPLPIAGNPAAGLFRFRPDGGGGSAPGSGGVDLVGDRLHRGAVTSRDQRQLVIAAFL